VVRICFECAFDSFVHKSDCHHVNVAQFLFLSDNAAPLMELKMSSLVVQLQWRTVCVMCSFGVNLEGKGLWGEVSMGGYLPHIINCSLVDLHYTLLSQ
jgi:hypothetical protein